MDLAEGGFPVTVPRFDRTCAAGVLVEKLVGDGATVRWGYPVAKLDTDVGIVPVWTSVGGIVRWNQTLGATVRVGDQLANVESAQSLQWAPAVPPNPTATLIVVYYGKLPNYFPLFLQGCSSNRWLNIQIVGEPVFEAGVELPENVQIRAMPLAELIQRCRRVLGFAPAIARPYKLCDLKPAYLHLFPDFIEGYTWAGWGDVDLIYGDLDFFLRPALCQRYQLILRQGSFCLCRVNELMTTLYRLKLPNRLNYETAYRDPVNRIFDEFNGFEGFAESLNLPLHIPPIVADISYDRYRAMLSHTWGREVNYERQIVTWREGHLYREAWQDGRYLRREFGYVHYQKRRFRLPMPTGPNYAIGAATFRAIGPGPVPPEVMEDMNPSRPAKDALYRAWGPIRRISRKLRERRLRAEYARLQRAVPDELTSQIRGQQ